MTDQDKLQEKFEDTELEEVAASLPEVPETFRQYLEDILLGSLDYEAGEKEEDVLRGLMKTCDSLLSDYQDQNPELPTELEELNDLLWTWFQDPPESLFALHSTLSEKLAALLPYLSESDQTDQKQRCAATTADGSRCRNSAKYPEADPQYCSVHQDQAEQAETETESPRESEKKTGTETAESKSEHPEGEVLVTELDVEPDIAADFLMEANEQLETLDNMLVQIEDNPDENSLNELFRCMHSLKGGFGFCGLETCTELTHAAEDLLGILRDDIPETISAAWLDLMFATLDSVRAILVAMEEAVVEGSRKLEIPLSANFINTLEADLRAACEGETGLEAFTSLEQKEEEAGGGHEELGEETINVELSQIDNIVDLVGELVISHSGLRDQLDDQLDYKLDNTLNQQDKILDQLQRRSMNMRMLPMKKEFNKLPRIVRDLSRDTEKEVNLNITGAETGIDKSVLDSLHDPLVHLVRNAIDHGIESPEERKKAGKPVEGQLDIRAYHESGNVYIEVEEDGAGLPREVVEQKAIERDVIPEDHDLEPEGIDRLIFRPGFSTADEVTDVSGRGVGMDVVASKIDELRGTIDIDSTPGEGTKFTVELPLTVAIIDGLIAKIGDERMIFPVNQVAESINPTADDINYMQEKGRVVRYRDTVIPLIDPGELIASAEPDESVDKRTIYVVVRSNMGEFAVRVDELQSHEQVVIKNLGKGEIEDADLVSGGAILGDGSVGLILDIASVIRAYREHKR
ncbi:chemotaxis protein CheA [Candidatus Bipolaricaulota bacterium]|nr:chemotaxis protein CheA [Candidatus Bipolaricaulota bacterium]